MTLDVEMHSSVIVLGASEQARGGFTTTSDRDTAFGAYMDGNLLAGTDKLDAGQRLVSYFFYAPVAKKTLRFHTFTYGVSPPSSEPTDRQPELEFVVEAVGYETKYPTLKDKDTGEDVKAFITFVKKDSPHLYNTVTDASGVTILSSSATIPTGDWIMVVERRLDDKAMYYEVFDVANIPADFSEIRMPKRSEALVRLRVEVSWDGFVALLNNLLLYTDPLFWAFQAISKVAPEYAVWLFNLLFTIDMPAYLRADLIAVRSIDLTTYELDVRVTPNSLKGWMITLAKQLAKWSARLLFAGMAIAGAYLIIREVKTIAVPQAEILANITATLNKLSEDQKKIIEMIMADATLTPEQKIRAIEAVSQTTANAMRTLEQTAEEVKPAPTPWTTYLVIGGVVVVGVATLLWFLTKR